MFEASSNPYNQYHFSINRHIGVEVVASETKVDEIMQRSAAEWENYTDGRTSSFSSYHVLLYKFIISP